ncbi:MAG: hypothetical protein JST38_08410 [Bacteroidetes bacterium]|nr:hypothetical protein [Bacteroidota bacterium]
MSQDNNTPRFNLPGMLSVLYGIAAPVSYPEAMEAAKHEAPRVSFAGIEVVPDSSVLAKSSIGTPVLHPILFVGAPAYKRFDADGRVVEERMDDLRLPVTSVAEMSCEKSIITTQVSAARGSVKEVYSDGDWSIRISGIIMDERNHPQGASTLEMMENRLLKYERLADSIEVRSDMFNRRDVHRLVIRSISFNQIPGKPRLVGYQMQCDSDTPLELLLK